MLNKVMLIGNLGMTPELKTTQSGTALCELRLATSEMSRDAQGNKQERTEWHRIIVFGQQAESVCKYLSKGSKVHVEGRIQTREWQDKDGQKRYATEIVASHVLFLERKQDGVGSGVRNSEPTPF